MRILFKSFLLTAGVALLAAALPFSAEAATYRAKLTVTASDAGGTVAANTSSSTPSASSYAASASTTGSKSGYSGSATVTLYAFAKAADGYVFSHWSESKGGTSVSTANPYTVSITATSTSSTSPTTKTLYAVFKSTSVPAADLTGDGMRISEICPKPLRACPTDSTQTTDGVDPNGVTAGWIELVNAGSASVNLSDYKLVTVNRGKNLKAKDFGNLPAKTVAAGERVLVYTTEGYIEGDDLMFASPLMAEKEARYFKAGEQAGITADAIVLATKVNPKKFPMVQLLKGSDVIDTVIVPADLPDDASVVVQDPGTDGATLRYLSTKPTPGAADDISGAVKLGPNIGPLYGLKHAFSDLDPVPPAVSGQDYAISLDVNPVNSANAKDAIKSVTLVYRTHAGAVTSAVQRITMVSNSWDSAHGAIWKASVPSAKLPAAGMLLQWKAEITDVAGNTWTSPAFNGKDAGYEWYGTIVDPGVGDGAGQNSATIPTWHMFVIAGETSYPVTDKPTGQTGALRDGCLMNLDYDETYNPPSSKDSSTKQAYRARYPYGARCAIYDMQTSNYYDNVRIDCRGNSSDDYYKRSHGLKFSKIKPYRLAEPFVHPVSGIEVDTISKTSLCAEYNDPAQFRQRLSFWFLNLVGVHAPWEHPKRVNLNGAFYQFAYESPRFSEELLCDIYGFDPRGYGYKNVGSLHTGTGTDDYGYSMGTTASAGTKKKTPDDGNEKDFTELLTLFNQVSGAANVKESIQNPSESTANLNQTELTKNVVRYFDLPAWLNYLAATHITQEGDDAWGNLSLFYDNAQLLDGTARGNGTWRPVAWDLNCAWGQFYTAHVGSIRTGIHADQDWNKCHPFYGGMRIWGYQSSSVMTTTSTSAPSSFYGTKGVNYGFESIFQSTKFRRLFLRRFRTLMDNYLKDVGTAESDTPIAVQMRAYADEILSENRKDRTLWGALGTNSSNYDCTWVNCWGTVGTVSDTQAANQQPADSDAAYTDIWKHYIVPRRVHLFQTHSVNDPNKKGIGYGLKLCAGIPAKQSAISSLKAKITAEYDATVGATVIRNANAETIDLSGWKVSGPVTMTLPPGTVIDQGTDSTPAELFVTADRRTTISKMTLSDQVVVGNGDAGAASAPIDLVTAAGEAIIKSFDPDTEIIEGSYPGGLAIGLTKSSVIRFRDAEFAAPLTVVGADFTIVVESGKTAKLPQIKSEGCNVTLDCAGTLELSGSEKLMTCADLVISNGTLKLEYTGATEGSMAVEMTGSYLQYGGSVTMNLKSSVQVFGFWCDTKGAVAEIRGGTFTTTIDGGENSATFKLKKGSNDVLLQGGEIAINLAGVSPRFVNTDGKLEFAGSRISVATLNGSDGKTPSGTDARVFKSVKAMKITGGAVTGSALGAGSEIFSSDNKITVSGGTVSVVADDDCFSATTNITISAGRVHAVSKSGDAIDSNGNMLISGGHVFAFALSSVGEGLDVDPVVGEAEGLDHTLVISGGTVLAVGYDKLLHAPDAGSVGCYVVASMTSDKAYAEITGRDAENVTTTTVGWNGLHAAKFSVIATCPGYDGKLATTDVCPDVAAANVGKLDELIDGVYLTTRAVVPVVAKGDTEPGTGSVPSGGLSRFDATVKVDGEAHTLATDKLAAALSGSGVSGLTVTYAAGGKDFAPETGWSTEAPTFTEPGVHYVWYRVSAAGYEDFIHVTQVKIRPAVPVVVINEVQSSNDETLVDEFGEDSDWAELYNTSEETVDLSGWGLSDKASKPYKWMFPSGTTLAPGKYLIVYCSGVEKTGTQIHSSLSLSGSGETLTLTDLSGEKVDAMTFGALPADTSFGRVSLGGDAYTNKWFATPTPGAANSATAYEEPLEPVRFSKERGVFTGSTSFTVTLSHTNSSAKIWYTLDHSDPSPTNKTAVLYSGTGISVSKTTIIRATAVLDGHLPYRNIISQSYLYLDQIVNQTKPSNAPDTWTDLKKDSTTEQGSCKASYTVSTKTILTTDAAKRQFLEALGKAPVMSVTLSDVDLFDQATGVYCKPVSLEGLKKAASVEWVTGNHVFCTDAGLCAHGGASRHFEYTPKKSFGLKFRGRFGASKLDRPVMDDIGYERDEFKSLVLRAESNHSWTHIDAPDKGTSMHDQFLRDVFGSMTGVQSHGNQVHLFLNGLYWGLYNVVEALDDHFAAAEWGGENEEYDVLVGDRHDDTGMEVRDGESADYVKLVSELKALAKTDVKAMYEKACAEIDLDMLIDYMLLEWYIGNTDWPQKNWTAMMSVSRGVPLRYVAWDLDQSMINVTDDRVSFDTVAKYPTTTNSVQVVQRTLENSPEYRLRFADHIHRHFYNDGVMTVAALTNRYAVMADRIRPMVFAEVARWGAYRKDYASGTLYNMTTWTNEYKRLTGTYFPQRWSNYRTQLVNQKLYPSTAAAEFSAGATDSEVKLSIPSGTTVYYTTDGSDPREAYTGNPVGTAYASGGTIAATTEDIVVRARAYNSSTKEWSALSEIELAAPPYVVNEFNKTTNGESWDADANWTRGYYPNAAGETAAIGAPTKVKKDKGWRNIHIDSHDITVGCIQMTNGGWTNRIDTGTSGNLTLCGAEGEDASFVVMDEDNAGLAMIDLDSPNVLALGSDTDFVVSNVTGDVNYGGLLIKGAIAGNDHNLQKLGAGRLTISATNATGTALGNLQCVEGVVAVQKPLSVASVTKKTGTLWVLAGETDPELASVSAVVSGDKVNPNVCLFVPTNGVNALWYGGVVAKNELKPASVTVYIRDTAGDVRFAGERWSVCTEAKASKKTLADSRLTYEISVPVPAKPRDLSAVAWDYVAAFTYDNKPHGVALTGVPDGVAVEYANITNTAADSYVASAHLTAAATANYLAVDFKTNLTWKIEPRSGVVVTVVGNCVTNTYDGKEHTAKGYKITDNSALYDTAFVKFTGTESVTKTAVGAYAMGLKESDFANTNKNFTSVTFKVTDGELVIKQATYDLSKLAWDYTGVFTYDNKPHGVALTGVPAGVAVEYANITNTAADTYTASAHLTAAAGNYEKVDFTTNLTWKIAPRSGVVVTVVGNCVTNVFNGKEHTASGYAITDNSELYDSAFVKFTGSASVTKTDVGVYAMGLKESDFANTNRNFTGVVFMVTDGELVIDPAFPDIENVKWDYSAAFVYDGKPHSVALTGIPEGVSAEYECCVATTAGTYVARAKLFTTSGNYKLSATVDDLEWRIEPSAEPIIVTVVGKRASYVYDGKSHKASGLTMSASSELFDVSKSVEYHGVVKVTATNAGTYYMQLDEAKFSNADPNFSNVIFEVTDGELVIRQAENLWVTQPEVQSKVYDGMPASVSSGVSKFGSVAVAYDSGSSIAPTGAGKHQAIFTVSETSNYGGLVFTLDYEITGGATVDGKEYASMEEAVKAATSKSPIVFAEAPSVDNDSHTITPSGGDPIAVPDYYDIALNGKVVSLSLNESAVPTITEGTEEIGGEIRKIPALEVDLEGSGEVGLCTSTRVGLYYALAVGDDPAELAVPKGAEWTVGDGNTLQLRASKTDGNSGYYRVTVTDYLAE